MTFSTADALTTNEETPRWQFAVGSGVLGWVLDAFDFFVVFFLLTRWLHASM